RYGGCANLAETDELLGSESYVLQKVRNLETARKFLHFIDRFKERVAWHGTTAEGNPSGGNKFRGLYNIAIKSIGAAMKRDPEVRLDYVIDYGERMLEPGYYFMDSPGNDLESIAGQVAAGCNMIFFVTGNGSITNFPFVPTLKIVTTSRRYDLLQKEMDVNAGAYLDGQPMEALGQETLNLTIDVASGQQTVGEKAGHAQVQIWRNWRQQNSDQLENLLAKPKPKGHPIPLKATHSGFNIPEFHFQAVETEDGFSNDQIGLILPTSLCAGQIARMATDRLNQQQLGKPDSLSRYVTLVHTEGCGASSNSQATYIETLLGYLSHPMVKHCLLLEHGCEQTHNDYMWHRIKEGGIDPTKLGWASVQLDGGIEPVIQKIQQWFGTQVSAVEPTTYHTVGLEALRVGIITSDNTSPALMHILEQATHTIVSRGGTVIVPESSDLLSPNSLYNKALFDDSILTASLAYSQRAAVSGFHSMETPTGHWVETLTGLGATGVDIIIAAIEDRPRQGHPFIPTLQITASTDIGKQYGDDIDLWVSDNEADGTTQLFQRLEEILNKSYIPKSYKVGNVDFQITRGLLGVSL
ncbi:MAG: UxaA family hydrolase, partial [Chloroflexota bacterium]